jgi:hypothetical protein
MSNEAGAGKLLIVGDSGPEHVGSHLLHAARELGLNVAFADSREASGNALAGRISWRFLGRRPAALGSFGRKVVRLCHDFRPETLLTTGFAPVAAESLERLGEIGVYKINFLTDDPWNRRQRAPWFLRAVQQYDEVLSTRQANLEDLKKLGCRGVRYVPFGFASHMHFPERLSAARKREMESDVIFAGGADCDRVPYIAALDKAGFRVGLYGGYWDRFPETRHLTHGLKPPEIVREAVAAAKVALCLVRRANRDGVCMRTFEVPAMGGCMLVEKTAEHVELFGTEGQAVLYFDAIPEMTEKTRWLLEHDTERERLRSAAHELIARGNHTYRDRLNSILNLNRSRAA